MARPATWQPRSGITSHRKSFCASSSSRAMLMEYSLPKAARQDPEFKSAVDEMLEAVEHFCMHAHVVVVTPAPTGAIDSRTGLRTTLEQVQDTEELVNLMVEMNDKLAAGRDAAEDMKVNEVLMSEEATESRNLLEVTMEEPDEATNLLGVTFE